MQTEADTQDRWYCRCYPIFCVQDHKTCEAYLCGISHDRDLHMTKTTLLAGSLDPCKV